MGKGFDIFMDNPYWRRIYENAPSEELKEYYKIRFDISPFVYGENYHDDAALARLEEILLSKSDIEYIQRFAGSGMARHFYEKFISKLTGEYEGWCFKASIFQAEIWNPWYQENGEVKWIKRDNAWL